MKILFVSDIHGSAYYMEKVSEVFKKEDARYMAILGDALYHGARNPLPAAYDTQKTAELLNALADKVIAVRGNCDSEVDEMVLHYPMAASYAIILYNGRRLFLTHGHVYDEGKLPKLSAGDVFIHGHTHIPRAEKVGDIYILNPGSITFPKEGHPNTYGILEENTFRIVDFDGNTYRSIRFE